jgi:hypothetical protein
MSMLWERIHDSPETATLRLINPTIHIIKAFNIVFAEIITGLNFDEFEWDFTRVAKPMLFTDRDKR